MKPEVINANIIGTILSIQRDTTDSRVQADAALEFNHDLSEKDTKAYERQIEYSNKLDAACEVVIQAIRERTKHGFLIEPVGNNGLIVTHTIEGWETE